MYKKIVFCLLVLFLFGCVNQWKRARELRDQRINDYKLLCEELNKWLKHYDKLSGDLSEDWNDFHYNLTYHQIDKMDLYNKYKNRDSYEFFLGSLSLGQVGEFKRLQRNYEAINKYRKGAEVFRIKIEEYRKWLIGVMKEHQRLEASQDATFFNMVNEIQRTSDAMNRQNFNTQLLNTLGGIERSLW